MSRITRKATRINRRALVLILVLIVIVMLSLGAYSFTDLMLAHHEAAQLTGRQVQARGLVDIGRRSRSPLPGAARRRSGSMPAACSTTPKLFRGVTLIADDDPDGRGSFSVLAPNLDERRQSRRHAVTAWKTNRPG